MRVTTVCNFKYYTMLPITFFSAFGVLIFYSESDNPVKIIHKINDE